MAEYIIPALMEALFEQASTSLPDGTNVSYGYSDIDDDGDWFMVGVPDPFTTAQANASSGTQVMATAGTPRSRTGNGSVPCHAYSSNTDRDQKAAVEAAWAMFETVAQLLRDDPRLGIQQAGVGYIVLQVIDWNLYINDTVDDGAEALVVFTVGNEARI